MLSKSKDKKKQPEESLLFRPRAQIYRALDSGSLLDEMEANPEAWEWLDGEGALSMTDTPGKDVPFSLAYNPKTGTGTGNVGMTALRGVPTDLSMVPGDAGLGRQLLR